MKLVTLLLISLISVSTFAKDKKSRKPASSEPGKCEAEVSKAVISTVAALRNLKEEDFSVESIRKDRGSGHHEGYIVHLNSDESLDEAKEPITVQVYSTSKGCRLDSITMPPVLRDIDQ